MNCAKLLLMIVCICLLNFPAYSQTSQWINYTNTDRIYAIVDDSDNLWIGTDGGLVKLDKTTENLTFYNRANANLPDNHIRSLALDSSGYLWIGTRYSGIGKFNGDKCQVFNTANSGLPHDQWNTAIATAPDGKIWIGSLPFLTIFDGAIWKSYETGSPISSYIAIWDIVFDSKGSTWIGATWGLGKFSGDSLIQEYAGIKKDIYSLAIDKNDTLWVGTNGSGLIKFDGANKTVFDTSNSPIPSNYISDIKLDSHGNLWLATPKGLVKFDGSNWVIYNSQNFEIPPNSIYRIEIDNDNIIWIGTLGKGLFKFDGVNWKKYKLSNSGHLDNGVSSFAFDANGNRWINCYHDKLIKFDGLKWEYYDSTNFDILNSSFNNVYSDSARKIWIGSGVLISFETTSKWRVYNVNNPHSGSKTKIDKQGNIWEASYTGLKKFDGKNWMVYNKDNSPLPTNSIAIIAFDHQDNIWLSTLPNPGERGVLIKFDGTNWTTYYTCDIVYWITSIEIDISGNIWVGIMTDKVGIEFGGGLKKFDGTQWTSYDVYNSELPSNSVVALRLDKNDNLWIGTYAGGLAKFNGKNEWPTYNVKNSGLPGNNVELIEIDSMNNKWLGVQFSGLSVFNERGVILTEIKNDKLPNLPQSFFLSQNYPNPFNPVTQIRYGIPSDSKVTVKIYDVLGKEVAVLINNEFQNAGWHTATWDSRDYSGNTAASGIYFCRLIAGTQVQIIKLILMR